MLVRFSPYKSSTYVYVVYDMYYSVWYINDLGHLSVL